MKSVALCPRFAGLLLVFAISMSETCRAEMSPEIQGVLGGIAEKLLKALDAEQQKRVSLGDFSPLAKSNSTYGPSLTSALGSLLNERRPGVVSSSAKYTVRGRFELPTVTNPETGDSTLKLTSGSGLREIDLKIICELYDGNLQSIDRWRSEGTIRDPATIARILGVSFETPPGADYRVKNDKLAATLTSTLLLPAEVEEIPVNGHLEGTLIRAEQGSAYAVEILAAPVSSAPKSIREWSKVPPRQPRIVDGQVFVDLAEDEVYAVKVYNHSAEDVAVFTEIDGLDVFSFSEIRDDDGQPKYSFYTIEAGGPPERIIPGWHKTNQRVDSFLVTEYGKGASTAGLTKKQALGMITVSFAVTWVGEPSSPVATAIARNTRSANKKLETGFGPSMDVSQTEAERSVDKPSTVIAIRYSTH